MEARALKQNISDEKSPMLGSKDYDNVSAIRQKMYWGLSFLLLFVAFADGAGFAALSLSQIITTLSSLDLIEQDPEAFTAFWPRIHLYLLAGIGGLATMALAVTNNRKLLKKHLLNSNPQPSTRAASDSNFIKYYCWDRLPLTITVLSCAVTEGTIIYSNIGYLSNQFGYEFSESPFRIPAYTIASLAGFEYFLLDGQKLIELIEQGCSIKTDRVNAIENSILKYCARFLIFSPAILSAVAFGLLGASESYQVMQYIMEGIETHDRVADRIAWIPALFLGTIYAFGRFSLYGVDLISYLDKKIAPLFYKNTWEKLSWPKFTKCLEYCRNTSCLKMLKDILLLLPKSMQLSIRVIIPALFGFIAYGAIEETVYSLRNRQPPPTPTQPMVILPLGHAAYVATWIKAFYVIPALAAAIEAHVAEGKELDEKIRKILPCFKKVKETNQKERKENKNVYNYHPYSFVKDLLIGTLVLSVKLTVDFLVLPETVHYDQITIRQNLSTSALVALVGALINLSQMLYKKITMEDSTIRQTRHVNEATGLTNKVYLYRREETLRYAALHFLTIGVLTSSTQLIMRYGVLGHLAKEDLDHALDYAQKISAIIGGISTVGVRRLTDRYVNVGHSWSLFACCRPKQKDSQEALTNLMEEGAEKPQVKEGKEEEEFESDSHVFSYH